ncbi:MAG: class I SAM-dependent methyltransferase [Candidatus Krumholzibacteriia bacterium]
MRTKPERPLTSPPSPLTGSTACRPVARLAASDLVLLYRRLRGLEVASELTADTLTLWHDEPARFWFFDPPCAGSGRFYADLTARPHYAADKSEYRFAASLVNPGERLLDVGCGWGLFATHVPGVRYTGLDPSGAASAAARARGLDVRQDLVEEVAAREPGGYDVVTSFQVLEHLADPAAFFRGCAGCVRPGGLLVIAVPNADSFMGVRANNYLNYPPHHVTWWTLTSLLQLGARHGLHAVAAHTDAAAGLELAMSHAAVLQVGLDRLRGGRLPLVRNGTGERLVLKGCDAVGRLLAVAGPPSPLSPPGHSLAVAFRQL